MQALQCEDNVNIDACKFHKTKAMLKTMLASFAILNQCCKWCLQVSQFRVNSDRLSPIKKPTIVLKKQQLDSKATWKKLHLFSIFNFQSFDKNCLSKLINMKNRKIGVSFFLQFVDESNCYFIAKMSHFFMGLNWLMLQAIFTILRESFECF